MNIQEEASKQVDCLEKKLRDGSIKSISYDILESTYPDTALRQEIIKETKKRGLSILPFQSTNILTPLDEMKICSTYKRGCEAEELLKVMKFLNKNLIQELEILVKCKQTAFEMICKQYNFMIKNIIARYHPKPSDFEDLFQAALMGVYDALNEVDFQNHENSLSTFMYTKILARVQDEKERKTASIPVSHTVLRQSRKYFKYKEEHDGDISDLKAIGECLDLKVETEKDLNDIRKKILIFEQNINSAVSLHSKINGDDNKEIEIIDSLASSEEDAIERRIRIDRDKAFKNILRSYLNNEEQIVYFSRIFEKMKYDEIMALCNSKALWIKFGRKIPYDKSLISNIYQKAERKIISKKNEIQEKMKDYI